MICLSLLPGLLVQGDIPDLLNQLWTVAAVWDTLGLQLGVSQATLNVITRDHPTTRERFTKMLEEWVKGKATKGMLIKALQSNMLQDHTYKIYKDIQSYTLTMAQCTL